MIMMHANIHFKYANIIKLEAPLNVILIVSLCVIAQENNSDILLDIITVGIGWSEKKIFGSFTQLSWQCRHLVPR